MKQRTSALLLAALLLLTAACREQQPVSREELAARPADEQLVERLAIAYSALRDAEGARGRRGLEAVHRYAQTSVDAISGPAGRHARPIAPPTGVLPADSSAPGAEPGLAARTFAAAPAESPLRAALDETVMGGIDGWQRNPSERYDAVDRAVAAETGDGRTIAALPGEVERGLAWALYTLRAEDDTTGRARARQGAPHLRLALDAVRRARAAR